LISALLSIVAALLLLILFELEKPQRWHYTIIAPSDDQLTTILDKAGSEGYEMVFARRASNGEKGSDMKMAYEIIMKRKVSVFQLAPVSPLP